MEIWQYVSIYGETNPLWRILWRVPHQYKRPLYIGREIWQRVSFRSHTRNGLQCATTFRRGCIASFRTIEELVNHLVKKYGNLKNFPGNLNLLVYCTLKEGAHIASWHSFTSTHLARVSSVVQCLGLRQLLVQDIKRSHCKKKFKTHDSNYTRDTSRWHIGCRL